MVRILEPTFSLGERVFAPLALIFIMLWLMLDYAAGEAYSARMRRGKIIGRVSGVLGFIFLVIQILQWAQVI
jgi:hypothetical protein